MYSSSENQVRITFGEGIQTGYALMLYLLPMSVILSILVFALPPAESHAKLIVAAVRWSILLGLGTRVLLLQGKSALSGESSSVPVVFWVAAAGLHVMMAAIAEYGFKMFSVAPGLSCGISLVAAALYMLLILLPGVAIVPGLSFYGAVIVSVRHIVRRPSFSLKLYAFLLIPILGVIAVRLVLSHVAGIIHGNGRLILYAVTYSLLVMPAFGMAATSAASLRITDFGHPNWSENSTPQLLRVVAGTASLSCLSGALYLLLYALVPVRLMFANPFTLSVDPSSTLWWVMHLSAISPLSAIVLLIPGVIAGYIVLPITGRIWASPLVGILYGFIVLYGTWTALPIHNPLGAYGCALVPYILATLAGTLARLRLAPKGRA